MGKIFYLMGKSSSGKDTIYRNLMKEKDLQLKKIVPYTTRPIRANEKEGIQYHFTDVEGFNRLKEQGKIVEDRTYNTFYGEWKYFTVDDGDIKLDESNYLIIGTPESYNATKKYFSDEQVLPILIVVDDGERLSRALKRERKQETPKYEEMCRRFLADAEDFSEEKLNECGISKEYRFNNENLEDCIKAVKSFIERNR